MQKIILLLFLILSLHSYSQDFPEREICPLLVGSEIPNVTVNNLEGDTINLKEVLNTPTVLIFYRGGWCPYCKKHLSAIQEAEEEIKKKGFKVVGITPDHYSQIPNTIDKKDLNYEIYSDSLLRAATKFGIAYKMDDQTIKSYNKYMLNVDTWQQSTEYILPVPAVFIIKDGIITFSYVNPNYKTRLSAKTIIELLN